MSKNPYFAHLPTWRNRQDLAYALDSLPRILETMVASSPLIATYSYPSTATQSSLSSSPSTSSPSSTLSSSSSSPYGPTSATPSPPSSSPSSYTCSPSSAKVYSPSVFRERFMLDLAKECERSQSPSSRSPIVFSAPNTPCASRRASGNSSSFSTSSASDFNNTNNNGIATNGSNNGYNSGVGGNPFYPLQFSTRAKAMAFLIEILQSLQKAPCGCDLTKGCYCGRDGIEDHEGKSPCYVCGEWFPDASHGYIGGSSGNGDYGQGQGQKQGRAWHEQGSLRHHVAESRVKKWLDSVWRPPLTPATTPEQENVKQFGIKSQEDLLRLHHQQSQYQNHQQQYQQPTPYRLSWNHAPLEHQSAQHQRQQQNAYLGRPWSFHDIEIEARTKSRSRQNSSSSMCSSLSASSYSQGCSSYQQQHQEMSGPGYGNYSGAGSTTWRLAASPKPMGATPPPVSCLPFRSMQLTPQPCADYPSYPRHTSMDDYQPRTRTQSCSDSQQPSYAGINGSSSSLPSPSAQPSFTPPVVRPSSCNSSRAASRSKPVRASTAHSTFAIPQEILDPSYRSPTFRIKSWNPPPPPPPTPSSYRELNFAAPAFSEIMRQTLDEWTSSGAAEVATKSSSRRTSDQEDGVMESPRAGIQGNSRESSSGFVVTQAPAPTRAPFQFSFTSQRFQTAVQASLEKESAQCPSEPEVDMDSEAEEDAAAEDVKPERDSEAWIETSFLPLPSSGRTIQHTAMCPELWVTDVSTDEDESSSITDVGSPGCTLESRSHILDPNLESENRHLFRSVPLYVPSSPQMTKELPLDRSLATGVGEIDLNDSDKDGDGNSMLSTIASPAPQSLGSPQHSHASSQGRGIQKSAPMSPLTPQNPCTGIAGSDLINALSSSLPTTASSSPYLCSSPSLYSMSTPTSPVLPIDIGDGGVGSGVGNMKKAGSWTSLHRLMRKMTKHNEAAIAKVASLPRSGRMHLDSS